MDKLDEQILELLRCDGRMSVKDISARVALTSPAVSERIRRMEKSGQIKGYTVLLGKEENSRSVDALISISVAPPDKTSFLQMVEDNADVQKCFHVTGSYSYIVRVCCCDMQRLEKMINSLQKLGQTSTQIILSTPVNRPHLL